jgi:hypothetical protein
MARYILCTPVYGAVPSVAPSGRKFGTGTTVADTLGNALPGDVVWASLCASAASSPNTMRPLDAAGAAVMGLPIITLQQLATNNPCLGSGAGLDAGD